MNEHGNKNEREQASEPELVASEAEANAAVHAEALFRNEETDSANSADKQPQDFEAQAREYYDRLVRTTADFENFRKRATRERQEAISFANESLLKNLLTVLDSFDKAQAAADTKETSVESLRTGVDMILQQFKSVLSEAGLAEIHATNQPFDPNWHEAISQQPTDKAPEGQVIQQVRKGYKLKDRLLRAAMVVIAAKPESGNS